MGTGGSTGKPAKRTIDGAVETAPQVVSVMPKGKHDASRDQTEPEPEYETTRRYDEPDPSVAINKKATFLDEVLKEADLGPADDVVVEVANTPPGSESAATGEREWDNMSNHVSHGSVIRVKQAPKQEAKQVGQVHLRPGQAVRIVGLENATYLNGRQGVLRNWDEDLGRWVVRLANGEEKGIRANNLTPMQTAGTGGNFSVGNSVSDQANKELEGLLLQTNWSAIYQLFYQRFGIAVLEKLEGGYVVKAAVEMSLSIVAKCFALLRSDPGGRLHCTPLHIAALQSSAEAAEVIVRDLPKLVEQTHKPSHSTLCPLHIAILCGAQAIVELLLEGRADANVRTLHDICPIHLAATTSKDLCQALLSYHAEPLRRDVMGSNAVHYAAAFKQHAVVELLLNNQSAAQRLAQEGDQKRVTPLHISCAMYSGEDDFAMPMSLLAHGAKPHLSDVSGAAARDLVPWSRDCALTKFFELHGNDVQPAAQAWMEKYLAKLEEEAQMRAEADPFSNVNEDAHRSEQGSDSRSIDNDKAEERTASKQQSDARQEPERTETGIGRTEVERIDVEEVNRMKEAFEAEVERLKLELSTSTEKCASLEQSAVNQQKNFEALQKLGEETRIQHNEQLDEIKKRHADERADLEARLNSQLDAANTEVDALKHSQEQATMQFNEQRRLFESKRQELEDELKKAKETALALPVHEQQSLLTPSATTRLTEAKPNLASTLTGFSSTLNGFGDALKKVVVESNHASAQELEKQNAVVKELTEQVQEFQELLEQEQNLRAQEVERSKAQMASLEEEAARLENRKNEVELELDQTRGQVAAKSTEIKTLSDQLRQLNDQMRQLQEQFSREKVQAEDRLQQLARDLQDANSRGSEATLAFEARISELELAMSRERSEADAARSRADAAEAQTAQMQPTINRLEERLKNLMTQFEEEQLLRKKFHNQIQDMKGAIRVFCRFRPMIKRERDLGDVACARRVDAFTAEVTNTTSRGGEQKPFSFDTVFSEEATQQEVFSDCKDLVQSAVDGYNVTIFAYGQTGAGKTWTMYGNHENPGLAPRSIHALFDVIKKEQRRGNKTFKVKTYMIEVYKQEIIDLLSDKPHHSDGKNHRGLEVKRDVGRGMMYVDGVTEREISSPEDLLQTLSQGERRRHTNSTSMNSCSSRSHLLLTIIVECNIKEGQNESVVYGKITLCDLAGSERPKKSEVTGDALKEAIEINKSLSALGDVIEALTKGSKSVPYRNHRLTMLMQDSLGGTAKTLMFVNCSPAGSNSEETIMSLKWASRARQITNDVKKNVDSKEVARLKQVIAMMSQAQNEIEPLNQPAAEELRAGLGMVS